MSIRPERLDRFVTDGSTIVITKTPEQVKKEREQEKQKPKKD